MVKQRAEGRDDSARPGEQPCCGVTLTLTQFKALKDDFYCIEDLTRCIEDNAELLALAIELCDTKRESSSFARRMYSLLDAYRCMMMPAAEELPQRTWHAAEKMHQLDPESDAGT